MDSKDSKKLNLQESILESIKKGETKMRPRWHFVLKAILLVVSCVIVATFMLYTASLVVFVMQQNGGLYAPMFGLRGVRAFLVSLPWLLILLAVIFIGILEILVRHYSFAYKRPLLYSISAIIIFIAMGSFAVARSPLHQNLYERAQSNRLPFAEHMYKRVDERKSKHIHPGMIVEVQPSSFIMQNRNAQNILVEITSRTKIVPKGTIKENQKVMVIGEKDGDVIRALGVRKAERLILPMGPGHKKGNPLPPQLAQ